MPGPPPTSKRQPKRGLSGGALMQLPAAGRKGATPKWPMADRPPKVWAELWRLPQAVAWEHLHLTRVVARYAVKLTAAEQADASSALLAEVRQMEDRLGLSAMAMLRLRWEITAEPVVAPAGVTHLDGYRDAV